VISIRCDAVGRAPSLSSREHADRRLIFVSASLYNCPLKRSPMLSVHRSLHGLVFVAFATAALACGSSADDGAAASDNALEQTHDEGYWFKSAQPSNYDREDAAASIRFGEVKAGKMDFILSTRRGGAPLRGTAVGAPDGTRSMVWKDGDCELAFAIKNMNERSIAVTQKGACTAISDGDRGGTYYGRFEMALDGRYDDGGSNYLFIRVGLKTDFNIEMGLTDGDASSPVIKQSATTYTTSLSSTFMGDDCTLTFDFLPLLPQVDGHKPGYNGVDVMTVTQSGSCLGHSFAGHYRARLAPAATSP
jgi:hypothetical protein